VAVPKVCGIETEYGVTLRGAADPNPVLASSVLINGYVEHHKVGWDFEDESPGRDARGFAREGSSPPEIETHLVNTVLTNGARYYVDHAHPEYSTPECADALELVVADKAGERILARSMLAARSLLEPGQEIVVYKNNSDGKGNSYGTHENYLVSRDVEFPHIVRAMVPHFVSRQVVVGAGKVGAETDSGIEAAPAFQLSSRSEFFEEVVGLETTLKRPIINTRDEPHADAERYRRLHVIIGDANMSQVATFVKLGSTALLLALLEDEGVRSFPSPPRHPVGAVRSFSLDTTLTYQVDCDDGKQRSAWEFQDELWHLAATYVERSGGDAVAPPEQVDQILQQWREMLDGVRDDRDSVADRVDWVAKARVVNGYRERYDLASGDARLRAIDLQYHDLRSERSLAQRVGLRELQTLDQVREAVHNPPTSTRAYFRGQCVERYPDQIAAANWDSVVFDLGEGPLRRVPMLDPLRGTQQLTKDLLETCPTADDLLEALDR